MAENFPAFHCLTYKSGFGFGSHQYILEQTVTSNKKCFSPTKYASLPAAKRKNERGECMSRCAHDSGDSFNDKRGVLLRSLPARLKMDNAFDPTFRVHLRWIFLHSGLQRYMVSAHYRLDSGH